MMPDNLRYGSKKCVGKIENAILTNIFETMNFNLILSNQAVGSLLTDCCRYIYANVHGRNGAEYGSMAVGLGKSDEREQHRLHVLAV